MGIMRPLDKAVVRQVEYDLLTPEAVAGEYKEEIGAACSNPSGYKKDYIFLAMIDEIQCLVQAKNDISFGDALILNSNCKITNFNEVNEIIMQAVEAEKQDIIDNKNAINSFASSLGPVENDETAQDSYTSGEQFTRNGKLCEAIANITAGDALVLNSNYAYADSLSDQVSSVKQDLSDEVSARSQLGAKNRLPLKLEQIKIYNTTGTWNGDTYTHNGIDFTLLFDSNNQIIGVNVNGTASDNAMFSLNQNVWSDFDFIMNGATAHTTLMVQNQNWSTFIEVTGNNDAVVKKDSTNTTIRKIAIWVTSGYSVSNEVVYPMFRLPSDSDKTYQPYAMTNQELTQDLKKGNILANAKAWPSDTLAFTLPQDNAKLYHFVAFSATATPQSDPASCVDAYFNIRTESVRYKVLSSDTISATYSDGVLTISLPANSYWLYKMELIKETTD